MKKTITLTDEEEKVLLEIAKKLPGLDGDGDTFTVYFHLFAGKVKILSPFITGGDTNAKHE